MLRRLVQHLDEFIAHDYLGDVVLQECLLLLERQRIPPGNCVADIPLPVPGGSARTRLI